MLYTKQKALVSYNRDSESIRIMIRMWHILNRNLRSQLGKTSPGYFRVWVFTPGLN